MEKWPIGVFASIDDGFGVHLDVARDLGVTTVHLHAPRIESRSPDRITEFQKQLAEFGLTVTCVFAGFPGESYADIPIVKDTVGLVPASSRAERIDDLKGICGFTRQLGVDVVGVHLGFIPHDEHDPAWADVVEVTRDVCDHCSSLNLSLHLETGQEPADALVKFIHTVAKPNLFVNFDPANMILYGSGEPIPAMQKLAPYIHSVHCKDAKWSDQPGETWGTEVPLGEGDVDFHAYMHTLESFGYAGPLTIEREIPQEPERQKAEIGRAIKLLNELKQELEA